MLLRHAWLSPCLASLWIASSVTAQPAPQHRHGLIFGTFSSLRYIGESGDVVGTEITVIPQYGKAYALVQRAEGAPSEPVLVPVTREARALTFSVESGNPMTDGHYSATVDARGMTLKIVAHNATSRSEFLPRRSSYWSR